MSPPIYPLILCGGLGRRLWPLSRPDCPKQFLALGSGRSLLAETLARVHGGFFAPPTLVTNVGHHHLVEKCLRDGGMISRQLILEPMRRGTAAAIVAGTLAILEDDPAPLILATPSDHIITEPDIFHAAIIRAIPAAKDGRIVTFGIPPTRPETGYGYIEPGHGLKSDDSLREIRRFHEKPDANAAQTYIETGKYLWNSGIFLFCTAALLAAFERFAPSILSSVHASLAEAVREGRLLYPSRTSFAASPYVSFDTAIMEKIGESVVIPTDMGWSDIGSWHSLRKAR